MCFYYRRTDEVWKKTRICEKNILYQKENECPWQKSDFGKRAFSGNECLENCLRGVGYPMSREAQPSYPSAHPRRLAHGQIVK